MGTYGKEFFLKSLKTPFLYQNVLKWNGVLLCYLVCKHCRHTTYLSNVLLKTTVMFAMQLWLNKLSFPGAYGVVLKCRHKVRSDSFSHNHLRHLLDLSHQTETPSKWSNPPPKRVRFGSPIKGSLPSTCMIGCSSWLVSGFYLTSCPCNYCV